MKQIKIIFKSIGVLALLLVCACEKGDSETEWGITNVYIPQATLFDGGITTRYPVPFSSTSNAKNYILDTVDAHKLKVVLGVYRSGLQQLESFSVQVNVDQTGTSEAITGVARGVVLPAETYTLPTEVTVADGQREAIFYLEVDLEKLLADYPQYGGNNMVLVVTISEPTKYTLNERLSQVTVVIDGSSFMPTPRIVPGGDFGSGSEQYWTFFNVVGTLPPSAAVIANGVLTFDYGTSTPIVGEVCYYHPIELQQGVTYRFSCNFSSTGGAAVNNCRFYLAVSPNLPVANVSYRYADGSAFYSMTDAWNGLATPKNGTLPQVGGWQERIDKATGVFTSNFSGVGYVVIGAAAWGSSIGTIVIDNVVIEEQ